MIENEKNFNVSKNLELVFSGQDYFSRLQTIIRNSQV